MHQAEAPSDPAGTLFHKNASDNELFALFMTETTVFLEVIINQIPNIDFCISTKEVFLINHKMYLFCCFLGFFFFSLHGFNILFIFWCVWFFIHISRKMKVAFVYAYTEAEWNKTCSFSISRPAGETLDVLLITQ